MLKEKNHNRSFIFYIILFNMKYLSFCLFVDLFKKYLLLFETLNTIGFLYYFGKIYDYSHFCDAKKYKLLTRFNEGAEFQYL